jgi:hypothetical protein
MWQKQKIQLANFDMASLRVIWFRRAAFGLPAHRNEQSRERQMQQPADVVLAKIARVLLRFNHVGSFTPR